MKVLALLLIALVAVATGFATMPTNASVPERMTYFGFGGVAYANGEVPMMTSSG